MRVKRNAANANQGLSRPSRSAGVQPQHSMAVSLSLCIRGWNETLRFNDTDQRELRSDTSLLRGDRDKPRASCYLQQCQYAKPTAHTPGLLYLWKWEYLTQSGDISSGKSTVPLSQTSLFVGLPTEACMAQAHSRVKPGLLSSITHILLPSVHAGHHAGSLKAAQPCQRPPVLSSRRAAALSSASPAPLPPSSPQQQRNKGLWVPKKFPVWGPSLVSPVTSAVLPHQGRGKKKKNTTKPPLST